MARLTFAIANSVNCALGEAAFSYPQDSTGELRALPIVSHGSVSKYDSSLRAIVACRGLSCLYC